MLSTLLLSSADSARVAGFDVASQPREVRRRSGLALGGDRGLFGRQNLQYFGAINHLSPREANRPSAELLELVRLGERGRSKVFEYSHGMKQWLHLARALLTEPDALFLDEPTSGLDPSAPSSSGSWSASSRSAAARSSRRRSRPCKWCNSAPS